MTDAVQIAIIAAIPPTLVALTGVILGFLNRGQIAKVHEEVNSRMTEMLKLTRESSHAQGMKDEKQEEHDRHA
jgi:hypothetical protein